ncbi:urease accessory protein UreF [Candidatus Nitrosacidococcus tergens]|uniref:Urease accessory protein UreF n=1 Tax=Candidatus Nitrosacidococcus tergens TaxID=553981 RepID=A0A7G1Q8H5_9GAMM|nr:urease accessory protein UreF [Candidatus Nitrosacidococcus tergens]CAB1275065.1 Urease accessory protein UreF [Candidatus Nitrosacidococcus tergens]
MNRAWSLLRLASPQLPIGAYSYSQGLESAIEQGIVHDTQSAKVWISDQLVLNISYFEAPLLFRILTAIANHKWEELTQWEAEYKASRETAELYGESQQLGFSLTQLMKQLPELNKELDQKILNVKDPSFFFAWSVAAYAWSLSPEDGLAAWLWSWLENQLIVLMKTLPLGQQASQNLLSQLLPVLDQAYHQAMTYTDDELANGTWGLAIASMNHEIQYSRLFRS